MKKLIFCFLSLNILPILVYAKDSNNPQYISLNDKVEIIKNTLAEDQENNKPFYYQKGNQLVAVVASTEENNKTIEKTSNLMNDFHNHYLNELKLEFYIRNIIEKSSKISEDIEYIKTMKEQLSIIEKTRKEAKLDADIYYLNFIKKSMKDDFYNYLKNINEILTEYKYSDDKFNLLKPYLMVQRNKINNFFAKNRLIGIEQIKFWCKDLPIALFDIKNFSKNIRKNLGSSLTKIRHYDIKSAVENFIILEKGMSVFFIKSEPTEIEYVSQIMKNHGFSLIENNQ